MEDQADRDGYHAKGCGKNDTPIVKVQKEVPLYPHCILAI